MEYKAADSIIISAAMRTGELECDDDMLATAGAGKPRCTCDGTERGKGREWLKIRITMETVVSSVVATESE